MDQHLNLELRKAAINRLAIEARLPEIASALGLRVTSTGNPPRALCPFHNDEHPSLHLYPSSQGRRAQFHCFACSAHGDVFDLVKKQLGTDFRGALEWLSARYAIRIPSGSTRPRREMQPRFDGLAIAFDLYRKERAEESLLFEKWALDRHFDKQLLRKVEVFAVSPPKLASHFSTSDREQLDSLETARLLRRNVARDYEASNLLPIELPFRDFFDSPRVVFTIRDERGVVNGFAGRALGNESPKYLVSPGFPRSSTLYRWHKVRSAQRSNVGDARDDIKHVFVVEGLMDALRLVSSNGVLVLVCLRILNSPMTLNTPPNTTTTLHKTKYLRLAL